MRDSFRIVNDFAALFKGRDSAYGVYLVNGVVDERGKVQGKAFTKSDKISLNSYAEHLEGTAGLGVIPITDSDKCYFGAIDVDDYSGKQHGILKMIERSGIPLCPFRSKSGGLHLFLFFPLDKPIFASALIPLLVEMREILGLPANTEIFPKQKSAKDGTGNWINLPYYGDSDRKMLSYDGVPLDIEDALPLCEQRRTGEDALKRMLEEIEFSDGPPCLQTLLLKNEFSARNNFLFSAARYYKAKYGEEDFEAKVLELNNALPDPLPEDEIEDTVLKSHKKKNYSYKCRDTPLCEYCLKVKCRSRRFGVGNSEVSELDFGVFTQFLTDPPYYEWEVNGKKLKFYSEGDLINQKYFQEQCVRHLNMKPSTLKAPAWDAILNTALRNVRVVGVDKGSEISASSALREYLVEFLTGRAMATNRTHILRGSVFLDPDEQAYIFRSSALNTFLFDFKKFTAMKRIQVMDVLRTLRCEQIQYFVSEGVPRLSVLKLPVESMQEYMSGHDVEVDVDFLEQANNEETEF